MEPSTTKLIEIWRLHLTVFEAAETVPHLIIREDEENIRLGSCTVGGFAVSRLTANGLTVGW